MIYFRWHLLTIIHYNHTVTVYYDDEEHHREITGSTFHLALDPKVFIGGGDNFVVTRGRCSVANRCRHTIMC